MKKVVEFVLWAIISLVVGGVIGGRLWLVYLPRSEVVLDGMAGATWVGMWFLAVILGSILGLVVETYIFRQNARR